MRDNQNTQNNKLSSFITKMILFMLHEMIKVLSKTPDFYLEITK